MPDVIVTDRFLCIERDWTNDTLTVLQRNMLTGEKLLKKNCHG